jgi:hypothetical protein
MSVTLTVSDEIAQHLDEFLPEGADVNDKLRTLLESEYRRRLANYHLTNRLLVQKYKMEFQTFERERTTEQRGYTWEVESDAIAWETAIDGIQTMEQRLAALAQGDPSGDH